VRRYRTVRFSAGFTRKAQARFPPDGSVDGMPTFEQFREKIMGVAEISLGRSFESYAAAEGSAAAVFVIAETQFFRTPMVLYARLIENGDVVEVYELEIDADWIDYDLEE
jgi:hypothetical protein